MAPSNSLMAFALNSGTGITDENPDLPGGNWDNKSHYETGAGKHEELREKHARQLKGRFNRFSEKIQNALGIDPEHDHESRALCEYVGVENTPMTSRQATEELLYEHFPDRHNKGFTQSFARFKAPKGISGKKERNSKDIYGIQIWVNDPAVIKKIMQLDSIQHQFWKACNNKNVQCNTDNHFKYPKAHGHRGIHYEAEHRSSNKQWTEWEEIQVYDANMMLAYLQSRKPYEALRALKAHASANGRKDPENFLAYETAMFGLLNTYINALYEEAAHESDLIKYTDRNHKHQPVYRSASDARRISDELESTVMEVVGAYYANNYDLGEMIVNRPDIFGLDDDEPIPTL